MDYIHFIYQVSNSMNASGNQIRVDDWDTDLKIMIVVPNKTYQQGTVGPNSWVAVTLVITINKGIIYSGKNNVWCLLMITALPNSFCEPNCRLSSTRTHHQNDFVHNCVLQMFQKKCVKRTNSTKILQKHHKIYQFWTLSWKWH